MNTPIMSPMFAGTLSNIKTYSLGMNAAPVEGGVASEELEALRREVKAKFDTVTLSVDEFASPATISVTSDDREQAYEADKFVRKALADKGVKFEYEQ